MKYFKLTIRVLVFLSITLSTGCYYDEIPEIQSIDREISFVVDVVPILNASCSQSGCHASGGIAPDLSPTRAYDELVTAEFVDLANPQESLLYKTLIGSESLMPPSGKLPDTEITLILGWIEQGALNN